MKKSQMEETANKINRITSRISYKGVGQKSSKLDLINNLEECENNKQLE